MSLLAHGMSEGAILALLGILGGMTAAVGAVFIWALRSLSAEAAQPPPPGGIRRRAVRHSVVFGGLLGSFLVPLATITLTGSRGSMVVIVDTLVGAFLGQMFGAVVGALCQVWPRKPPTLVGFASGGAVGAVLILFQTPYSGPGSHVGPFLLPAMALGGVFGAGIGVVVAAVLAVRRRVRYASPRRE